MHVFICVYTGVRMYVSAWYSLGSVSFRCLIVCVPYLINNVLHWIADIPLAGRVQNVLSSSARQSKPGSWTSGQNISWRVILILESRFHFGGNAWKAPLRTFKVISIFQNYLHIYLNPRRLAASCIYRSDFHPCHPPLFRPNQKILLCVGLINQSQSLKRLTKDRQTNANTQHTEMIQISMINPGVITAKVEICLCNWRLPKLPLRLWLLTSTALSAITFINNINTAIRSSVILLMPICLKIPLLATSYQPADKLNWHQLEQMFTQEM